MPSHTKIWKITLLLSLLWGALGSGVSLQAQPPITIWRYGAEVNATSLNIRNLPGLSGLILETVRDKTPLFYSNQEDGEWIRVRTEGGEEGWTIKHFLSIPEPQAEEPSPQTQFREQLVQEMETKQRYAVVKVPQLDVRYGPGPDHPSRYQLKEGSHVVLLQHSEDWLMVREPNRRESGWVARDQLQLYEPHHLPEALQSLSTEAGSPLASSIHEFMENAYQRGVIAREDQLFMVVQDLHAGQLLVSIRPRRHVKAASMIKVPILQAYMLQLYKGQIEHTPSNDKNLENMIRLSSNYSTNLILKRLGGPGVVQNLLDQTRMYRALRLVEYIPPGGRTYRNQVSAADLNQLFVRLWAGQALGPGFSELENRAASRRMLDYLGMDSSNRVHDRIKDGTCYSDNQQVKLWDKTGFVKGVNGNAGIVEIDTPHGRRAYSVVLIIERANYQSIAGNANAWSSGISEQMRRIAEMVYAYFNVRYEAADSCGFDQLLHHAKLAYEHQEQYRAAL